MRRVAPLTQQAMGCSLARCASEHPMLDIFMLALGLGFFALAVGYAYACERL
jgi:hypothetical protein